MVTRRYHPWFTPGRGAWVASQYAGCLSVLAGTSALADLVAGSAPTGLPPAGACVVVCAFAALADRVARSWSMTWLPSPVVHGSARSARSVSVFRSRVLQRRTTVVPTLAAMVRCAVVVAVVVAWRLAGALTDAGAGALADVWALMAGITVTGLVVREVRGAASGLIHPDLDAGWDRLATAASLASCVQALAASLTAALVAPVSSQPGHALVLGVALGAVCSAVVAAARAGRHGYAPPSVCEAVLGLLEDQRTYDEAARA